MKPLRKLLVAAGATALAWLAMEGVLRLVWPAGSSQGSAGLEELVGKLQDFATDYGAGRPVPDDSAHDPGAVPSGASDAGSVLHPYTAYSAKWENEWISRSQEQPRGPVQVLVLGGSVAAGFSGVGTSVLGSLIGKDPRFRGRRIVFLPFGQPGFKQPQQLFRLTHLLTQGITPDLVFDLSGFNEIAAGQANYNLGSHPAYPRHNKWLALAAPPEGEWQLRVERWTAWRDDLAGRADSLGDHWLARSEVWCEVRRRNLQGEVSALFAASENLAVEAAQSGAPEHLLGPKFDGGEEAVPQLVVEHWLESAISAHAICKARGIVYFPVLQPAAIDPGSQPLLPEEFRRSSGVSQHWVKGADEGYPLLRSAVLRLRERGIPGIDLSRIFVEEERPVFKDAVHLTYRGNEMLATQLAEDMLAGLPSGWKPGLAR